MLTSMLEWNLTLPVTVIKEMINTVKYIKLIAIIRINKTHIVFPQKLYHATFQFKSKLIRTKVKMYFTTV